LLQPGGLLDVNTYHVRKYVRALAFSLGSGSLQGTYLIPEEMATPRLYGKC
jgi:hypothetical protein